MHKVRKWSFFNKSEGSSLLTFAFIGPIFILLTLVSFELGLLLVIQNALNGAAREAGRYGIVENPAAGAGVTRSQAIDAKVKELAVEYSGGIIDASKLKSSIYSYASLGNINEPEPFVDANGDGIHQPLESFTDLNGNGSWDAGNGAAGSGGQGQAVVYELSYPFTSVAPMFDTFLANITLKGRTIIVNDLFSGG